MWEDLAFRPAALYLQFANHGSLRNASHNEFVTRDYQMSVLVAHGDNGAALTGEILASDVKFSACNSRKGLYLCDLRTWQLLGLMYFARHGLSRVLATHLYTT